MSTELFSIAFADDTNFAFRGEDINEIAAFVNKQLKIILNWYNANKLTLNFSKSNVILFTNNRALHSTCPDIYFDMIGNEECNEGSRYVIQRVERDQSIRFLGIWLDSELTFKEHFKKLYKKLSLALYALKRSKNFINQDSMRLLYYAFFHSHLEFSSTFLLSTTTNNIKKVSIAQKQAIRTLIGLPRNSHTAEAFSVLGILPFTSLMTFNVLKFMLKYETGQLSSSFNVDFKKNKDVRGRNLRNREEYNIPLTKSKKIENLPPFIFAKIRNDNKHHLPEFNHGDDYLEELKENLLDDYVIKNICRNSENCFICQRLSNEKDDRIKKKVGKMRRVEKIIMDRGLKKKERIENMLKKAKDITLRCASLS